MQPCPDEVVYPGCASDYSVKICLGDARVKDILRGPRLTATEIDSLGNQIVSDLLTSNGTRIASAILFSHLPVDGWYRYRDLFQILAAPDTAPRPTFLLADHPFVLQFRFPVSSNCAIRNIRKSAKQGEIVQALAGLLAGSVWPLAEGGRHHWVILPNETGKPRRAEYLQEGYYCPGFIPEANDFDPVERVPQLPKKHHREYYFSWGISSESRFEVPENLGQLLDRFYDLPAEHRAQFLRACYWFELAGRFYTSSRSAAFAALINSIEVLMPPKEKSSGCKECGQSLGKSATQRFVEFVDQMAPAEGRSDNTRKDLYRARSQLLHGSRLLPSDYLGLCPATAVVAEFENMEHAQRLVRLVLANWLRSRKHGAAALPPDEK